MRGKNCEIDAVNGVVCHWGKKNGVKTSINDRIVQIVKDLQSGKLQPMAENINLFRDLL